MGHSVTAITGFPRYNVSELPAQYRNRLWVKEVTEDIDVIRILNMNFSRDSLIMRGIGQFSSAFMLGLGPSLLVKPDVFIIYSPPIFLPGFIVLAQKIFKTPCIVNIQDLQPQSIIELGLLKNRMLIGAFKVIERFVYKNAAAITVHSLGNKRYVERNGGTPEKVFVIENFVDCNILAPGKRDNAFRKKYGLENKFLVTFGGVMGWCQDMEVILNAAERLLKYPEICIVLVGFGPKLDSIMENVKQRGLSNIRFVPLMSPEKYTEVLHATDLGLATLASTVKTPVVPSKIISYMATGTPTVLTSDSAGDAAKVVRESEAGQALPPADAEGLAQSILKYYRDKELFKRHSENARQYALEHFSLESCARKYEQLALDILSKAT